MSKYYKLLNSENNGDIIRVDFDTTEYKYNPELKKWEKGFYMMDYFFSFYDESPFTQDDYIEITEDEALVYAK